MKNLSRWIMCLALIVIGTSWMVAQDDSGAKGKSEGRTMRGCLMQGESASKFMLKATDGSSWEVKSDTVTLADHVGQMVSVTGIVEHATAHNLKEDAKDAAADAHMKKDNREEGDLKVTDLQKVSDSCQ